VGELQVNRERLAKMHNNIPRAPAHCALHGVMQLSIHHSVSKLGSRRLNNEEKQRSTSTNASL
jgi:hypothetical protein